MNPYRKGLNQKAISKFHFVLLIPLFIFVIICLTGFDGLYGQDSYEYLRYTKKLKAYILGGEYPGNLVWPKGYLFMAALMSFIVPPSLAGQLISLICFYLLFYYLYRTLQILNNKSNYTVAYAIIAVLLAPYLLRLSYVMMADSLAMLCLIATTYYALQYASKENFKSVVLCVFWASLGGFSRYAVLVPIAPIAFWTIMNWMKNRNISHLLALLIPIGLFTTHLYFEADGSDFLGHHFIENWNISNFFKREFIPAETSQLPTSNYLSPNIIFYLFSFFHPGFFFLSIITLIIYFRNWKKLVKSFPIALWISLLLYSLFLSGITFQGSRYLSLSYPLFALLLFPAFENFIKKVKYKTAFLFGLALIQLLLFYRAALPSFEMNKLERETAKALRPYEGETLYSFELDVGLKERGLKFNYLSLWEREYVKFEDNALLIFNEKRIAKTFEGKNPMNNWEKIQTNYKLLELKEIDEGWKLYRLRK